MIDGPRVIVALDYASAADALALSDRLDPAQCRVKIGKELFTAAGPSLAETLAGRGFGVFLDLKYHDIPNTVAAACRAAADLGVWMLNVHALGGPAMLEAARDAVAGRSRPPLLIGVTVLTSMAGADLRAVGIDATPADMVLRLAQLVRRCGLDGVVCSAQEAAALRMSVVAMTAPAVECLLVMSRVSETLLAVLDSQRSPEAETKRDEALQQESAVARSADDDLVTERAFRNLQRGPAQPRCDAARP